MVSAATLASGGVLLGSLGATRAAAQATPATGSTPAPPTSACPSRDPFGFLGDLPTFTVTSTDVADGQEMPAAQRRRPGCLSPASVDRPAGRRPEKCRDDVRPRCTDGWRFLALGRVQHPGDTTERSSGAGAPDATLLPAGSVQMPNDLRMPRYIGAAPPPGPSHRYVIGVFALDVPTLDGAPDLNLAVQNVSAFGHILAYGMLIPIASPAS